jgi:ankyrin repeat protein
VVQVLLTKGASPNIVAMGVTPFLAAAGVGNNPRGGAGAARANGPSIALMDLLLQHGADVNGQVTGTKSYSMRIARTPVAIEGMTALNAAAQAGRTDLVR